MTKYYRNLVANIAFSLEGVESWMLRDRDGLTRVIRSVKFERELVSALRNYLYILESMQVEPPFFVMASMLGVRGYNMLVSDMYEGPIRNSVDRDNLIMPEALIHTFEVDHPKIMKPIFDAIWNACGWEKSVNYDDSGVWKIGS